MKLMSLFAAALFALGLTATIASATCPSCTMPSSPGIEALALGVITGENLTGAIGDKSKTWSNLYKSEDLGVDVDTAGPDRAFNHLRMWGDGGAHAVDYGRGASNAGTAVKFEGAIRGAVALKRFQMPD